MFEMGLKIKSGFPADKVYKNLVFGAARGLTQTAKEAQSAVQGAARGRFTIRNKWLEQQNKFGIKVKPATPQTLTSAVKTDADWLLKQGEGGNIFPYKNYLAIPTANVRPKGSTKIIRGALRPANLKNAFVLTTANGTKLLMQRKGRGKKKANTVMYLLVKKVHIKPTDVFFEPIEKVVKRRMNEIVQASMQNALDTMR